MVPAGLPPLVQQMMEPSFYPHPAENVRLIQTHISYVLLAGEYAYKIKKPVNLGFLDFSTLERRHHFCDEELRLNRRGAPGLYLEVVAVNEPRPGHFRLGEGDAPVEYAVKMKRFPADALLSDELRRGALDEAGVRNLARRVAEFHASASPAPPGFGDPDSVRASIDDNFRHTERFATPGGPQFWEQLEETHAYTDRFIQAHHHLLVDRVMTGRIRECHGDLHLANIFRSPESGALLLFDCIEFNEQFRYVDVMDDVAFAAMDLRANGRADLENAFINEYAERTGDWLGLRVLPLYLCRQAYVRAKVNSLLWAQPEASAGARDAAFEAASRYYRLALDYTRPHPARLLLMCGLSGSGKSTIARQIAGRLEAFYLRADALRKHLAGVPLDAHGGKVLYTLEATRQTYDRLLEIGLQVALDGNTVILDATYLRSEHRATALHAARAAGMPIQIVHCAASIGILRDHLNRRTKDVSDSTAELLATQIQAFEPFNSAEAEVLVTVDTTRPIEPQLERILK